MTDIPYRTALIIGAGSGISASVARGLASAGLKVGLAARNVEKLETLATETGAQTFTVDASDPIDLYIDGSLPPKVRLHPGGLSTMLIVEPHADRPQPATARL